MITKVDRGLMDPDLRSAFDRLTTIMDACADLTPEMILRGMIIAHWEKQIFRRLEE